MTLSQQTKLKVILTTAHYDFEKGLNARAFFKLSNHETAEDVVQKTFMKTWIYLVKGGKIEIMEAFLYHILNNLIVDEYRKNKPSSLDVLLEKGFEPRDDSFNRLFNISDGKAAILLIKQLPLKYQKVVHMRYIQDLSLKEMSLITGMSKNNIAVQVHRGLNKLRFLQSHT